MSSSSTDYHDWPVTWYTTLKTGNIQWFSRKGYKQIEADFRCFDCQQVTEQLLTEHAGDLADLAGLPLCSNPLCEAWHVLKG